MLLRTLLLAAALGGLLPFSAQANVTPEFHQLLLEINGRLKNLAPGITRGPACVPNVVERAKEALQGHLATTALTKVVVEPLEAGAKVAAGALGIPAAAISTYSLVRCGMNESTPSGFAACVGGEVAGYAGGKALEKAGVGNLGGAIAGYAWGKAYGAVRGAIEAYARESESVEWTARGSCQTKLTAYWNRQPRPDARGGVIVVHAEFDQCECRTRREATAGSLRFIVPVLYTAAGNSQPGWSTGTPRQYLVEAQCCGQRRWDERVYQYNEAGHLVDTSGDDAPAKPQPPRTGSPAVRDTGSAADPWPPRPSQPVRLPPPKPEPVWSVENPCPACEPFKELMEVHLAAAQDAESKAASLESELARNAAEQEAVRARIAQLQEQLRMLEGQGGSAYDPATGMTTTAVTQADGSVLITVTDKQGREIERRTRDRRDSAQVRGKITQEGAALDALQRAAEQLQKDLAYQRALAAKQRKLANDALQALKHCLVEQCNQDPSRIFGPTALSVPPAPACRPRALPAWKRNRRKTSSPKSNAMRTSGTACPMPGAVPRSPKKTSWPRRTRPFRIARPGGSETEGRHPRRNRACDSRGQNREGRDCGTGDCATGDRSGRRAKRSGRAMESGLRTGSQRLVRPHFRGLFTRHGKKPLPAMRGVRASTERAGSADI